MRCLTILLPIALILPLLGCNNSIKQNENRLDFSVAYGLISSSLEKNVMIEPMSKEFDAEKNNGVTFTMTVFLDEAKGIANSCAKEKNQDYFEKCILRNYGKMEVNALNLSKYIETPSYISLNQNPRLRSVLDKTKSDKIITNDEFAHVVQVTQELMNERYRQQYKNNVINF